MRSLAKFDSAVNRDYDCRAAPHWAGGFGYSCKTGAEASRRMVRSFFYASRFMAGSVLGGREACRVLSPVDQPGTLSAAQSLVTLVGSLNPLDRSYT